MSRMKDLDMRLNELDNWHVAHADALKSMSHRMDQQLHLMQDMVKLESSIERLEMKIDANLQKLLDRLVEMTMIRIGDAQAANVHRAQSRLESTPPDSLSSVCNAGPDAGDEEDDWEDFKDTMGQN